MALHKMLVNLNVVKTGKEGLQYLSRSGRFEGVVRPDLILLDLNLPGLDGREVLKEIKSNHSLRQIPVVILTTSEADLDILKSYSMGANCYIVKPVDFDTFSKIVAQIEEFWFSVVKLPTHELVGKYDTSTANKGRLPTFQEVAKRPIQVLHVEDSDADADLVSESLGGLSDPRFIPKKVARLSDAFDYLKDHSVDVVLLDLSLPDSHGFETLSRFLEKAPNLPIVVLTGAEERELGVQSVREGAQDYLFKGQIESERLRRVILHAIERKILILAQAAAFEREHAALTEAEKAIGVRDEFLAIASHELRTPLTSLRIQIQLLRKVLKNGEGTDPIQGSVQALASQAETQIDRFSQLVERLLDFSRIQSGRLQLDCSSFDLNELVKESAEHFSPELQSAGCPVTLKLGHSVTGEWDRLRLEQVIVNLLSNATKYARGKPIEVSVDREGESVLIRVKDQGPGIAPEDKERIFQRFERAPGLRSISGLGLGLYVVRQIIDRHGGTVHVESDLGHGAAFVVKLPVSQRKALVA